MIEIWGIPSGGSYSSYGRQLQKLGRRMICQETLKWMIWQPKGNENALLFSNMSFLTDMAEQYHNCSWKITVVFTGRAFLLCFFASFYNVSKHQAVDVKWTLQTILLSHLIGHLQEKINQSIRLSIASQQNGKTVALLEYCAGKSLSSSSPSALLATIT